MDLLNKEEIALEWFWNKKKDEKKIERKIQPKEYLQKAKSTLQSLLNKPEFKDLKKYIKIKVDSNDANEFSEGNLNIAQLENTLIILKLKMIKLRLLNLKEI